MKGRGGLGRMQMKRETGFIECGRRQHVYNQTSKPSVCCNYWSMWITYLKYSKWHIWNTMTRHCLFVLKVLLNTNQTTTLNCFICMVLKCNCSCRRHCCNYICFEFLTETSCAGGHHNMPPPPASASRQYLRIYSPGRTCSGMLAV